MKLSPGSSVFPLRLNGNLAPTGRPCVSPEGGIRALSLGDAGPDPLHEGSSAEGLSYRFENSPRNTGERLLGPGADDDDATELLRPLLLEMTKDIEAVGARHHQVQEHGAVLGVPEALESLEAVRGLFVRNVAEVEDSGQKLSHVELVVDDEDAVVGH